MSKEKQTQQKLVNEDTVSTFDSFDFKCSTAVKCSSSSKDDTTGPPTADSCGTQFLIPFPTEHASTGDVTNASSYASSPHFEVSLSDLGLVSTGLVTGSVNANGAKPRAPALPGRGDTALPTPLDAVLARGTRGDKPRVCTFPAGKSALGKGTV